MYEIRIYNEYDKYGEYNDYVYDPDNDEQDADCLILSKTVETKEGVIKLWEELLSEYEGYTYCVREDGDVIVGGVYDPNDIDIIDEDYEDEE